MSVILCVYNAGAFLCPALLSILSQSYQNLEILIVDDGSTDDCMDSIRDVVDQRIRIFHQENSGKAVALNRALTELRGEFFTTQDADDLSYPRRIESQYRVFAEHAELAAVFCGYDLILDGRRIAPLLAAKSIETCWTDIAEFCMPSLDPTAMYRVAAVNEMRFDEELSIGQGLDYILRVGESHPMMVCGECLYSYRLTPGSATRGDVLRRDEFVRKTLTRAYRRRGVPKERWMLSSRKLKLSTRDLDNNLAAHFMDSVEDLRRAGRRWQAIRTGVQCIRQQPLDPHYYKALIFSVVPLWTLRFLRRRGPR